MASIPKTMKAAVCEKAGAGLQIKEVPVPEPEAHQVLIKVHACGVCHSDASAISGETGPAYDEGSRSLQFSNQAQDEVPSNSGA
jgi:NADPH:quinone reductase-like Zn-dependent oxidoreductase